MTNEPKIPREGEIECIIVDRVINQIIIIQEEKEKKNMKCKKCGTKMIKENLKFSSYVGIYKFAYWCPKCKREEEKKKEGYYVLDYFMANRLGNLCNYRWSCNSLGSERLS